MGKIYTRLRVLNPFKPEYVTDSSFRFFPSKDFLRVLIKQARDSKEEIKFNQAVKRINSQIKDNVELGEMELDYLVNTIVSEECQSPLKNNIMVSRKGYEYYLSAQLPDKNRTITYKLFKDYTEMKAQPFSKAHFTWRYIIEGLTDVFALVYYDLSCLGFIKGDRILTKQQLLRLMGERARKSLYTPQYFQMFYARVFQRYISDSPYELYKISCSDFELIRIRNQKRKIVKQAKIVIKSQKSPELYKLNLNKLESEIAQSIFGISAQEVINFLKNHS